MNDAGGAGTAFTIDSVFDGPASTISIVTSAAHGLAVGAIVSHANMTDANYEGIFVVVAVPTTTTYTVTATFAAVVFLLSRLRNVVALPIAKLMRWRELAVTLALCVTAGAATALLPVEGLGLVTRLVVRTGCFQASQPDKIPAANRPRMVGVRLLGAAFMECLLTSSEMARVRGG